ncbi:MAG TPA: serine/threonine-protein kinase [Polyangiaceae bacterium]|nr:serine/threonine-protein kinase [Polyangiaceae bacterium]
MRVPSSELKPQSPAKQAAGPERLEPAPEETIDVSAAWDERAAVRTAATLELPADLLTEGVGRLRGLTAIAALVLVAYLAALALLVPFTPGWASMRANCLTLLGVAAALSVAMHLVTRIEKLKPQLSRDLGYAYLILLSLLLGLLRHAGGWPAPELVRQVSPVALPILAFGALIPAAPRTSIGTLFGAACMDPLAFVMARSGDRTPPLAELALLFSSPFVAAFIAYEIARVAHRLSEGIVKAREVGSYRLVERLGVGGMAEVWRADHRLLARPAAVKLIRPKILVDHGPQEAERLLRLFLREARTTASLGSPHTIVLYDFGVTREGAFYYVMELLNGVDLKTLVDRFGPQTPERTAYLLRQVCHSLAEAHDRNFVHRDVKPANIFTCELGGDVDFAKVLDFGLVLDRHPTAEELEDERRFVGTPAIMAPEMVRFQAPVDRRADLYALGCVGYWLLTGKRVFEAETRHDMLVMHAHQRPVLPSVRIGQKLHAELEAVIMACLEKNPDRRPQTARELRDRLDALHFEHPWTEERAALWWRHYRPTAAPARSPAPLEAPSPRASVESDAPAEPEHAVGAEGSA